MKKINRIIATFIIVISAATFAFGSKIENEGKSLEVIKWENRLYKIIYHQKSDQKITLTVKDQANFVLYTESSKAENGFEKFLDLSQLPNGNYMVEIQSGEGFIYKEIEITNSEKKYKDVFYIKDIESEKVFVYSAKKLENKSTVLIKGNDEEILYQESIDLTEGKVFNFSQVIGDEVTLIIYQDNEFVQSKKISLN